MKSRTIKAIISGKFKDWLSSIDDENVRNLVKHNTIFTGGCIASMLLGEDVNDFDVYFRNYETTLAVARYYTDRFAPGARKGIPCRIFLADENDKELLQENDRHAYHRNMDAQGDTRIQVIIKSAGIASENESGTSYEYFETMPEGEARGYVSSVMDSVTEMAQSGEAAEVYDESEQIATHISDKGDDTSKAKYRPVFMSTNAITLSNKIQVVIRFYGDPDSIHENYDFVHCTNYWTSWDEKLTLNPEALESLLAKDLKYVGSKYPLCSMIRVRKFVQRGWSVNAGQLLKISLQISKLDLEDWKVLKEQLTGMDQAYFLEVLSKVKDKMNGGRIESSYLVEIIDRMF